MNGKGYIRIYTGNGQGKTTAAFGLAIRALGAGKRVYVGQFVKSIKYNETDLENHYPSLKIVQFGLRCFIGESPTAEDAFHARSGWSECEKALAYGEYDLVVLDELTIALYYNLIGIHDVLNGLKDRAPSVEAVITGRYAPQKLIDAADLVTEMREIRHYYSRGILSREGFDV